MDIYGNTTSCWLFPDKIAASLSLSFLLITFSEFLGSFLNYTELGEKENKYRSRDCSGNPGQFYDGTAF